MDWNGVAGLISSVGFPIVCCGALMWYVKYTIDKFNTSLAEMSQRHQAEAETWQQVVRANTEALLRLEGKLNE